MMVMTMQCINTFICCYCEDKAARIRIKSCLLPLKKVHQTSEQLRSREERLQKPPTITLHHHATISNLHLISYTIYYIDNDDLLTVERFLHFFAAKYVVQLHCVIIAPALGVLPNCFSLSTSIKKSFSIIYLIQFYNFVSLSRGSNKHQNVYGSVSYLPAAICVTVAVAGDCLL